MANDKELDKLRHSTAHLLASAVVQLYPGAKHTIGPVIENGFYYDFDLGDTKLNKADLKKIEEKMKDIVKGWDKFEKVDVTLSDVKKQFRKNLYKIELAEEFSKNGDKLTFYKSGDFIDLCRGGHIDSAKKIQHFKLLSIAGAYWKGSETNKMLTRIYGTAFFSQKDLDDFLEAQSKAESRDHRKIGRELDLFTFSELIGAGLPLYTPKGAIIRNLLNEYIESLQSKAGYQQVWTNQFAKDKLYKISGHYDKYKDSMFKVVSNYSDEEFFLKPMNCPQHTQIYASKPRSYKDLPLRYTDFAMLYRDEKPGELNGLARVRSFSQDDCHIFCREDQVDEEIDTMLSMIKEVMKTFGFSYRYRLSTRDPQHPEKYLGSPKTWDRVEAWAVDIMKRNKIDYFDAPGEAAFYAPKMDLLATDSLNREWQLSTIQIDYVMPERFKLEYTDSDGAKKPPVMLHRAIIGSPERFIMILLENSGGNLPTWLNPVQVKILPITDKNVKYAEGVYDKLRGEGIRAEIDSQNQTLQSKIRNAQLEKVSYMLIVGDKEAKGKTVSVRARSGKDYGQIKLNTFTHNIKKEIEEKRLD